MNQGSTIPSPVKLRITVPIFREARLQGLDRGTVAQIGACAAGYQPLGKSLLKSLPSRKVKEAAQRLWEQFREQVAEQTAARQEDIAS